MEVLILWLTQPQPDNASHTFNVESSDPDAIFVPSGEKPAKQTQLE
jgi:hypothetical protein